MWRKKYKQHPRRLALAAVAKETRETTPTIAAALPHLDPTHSEKLNLETLPALEAAKCPRFKLSDDPSTYGTMVRVFNQDSFDAAIIMPSTVLAIPDSESDEGKPTQTVEADTLNHLKTSAASPGNLDPCAAARVAVLNMASESSPGGGWLNGASAQEEALCYRSTLAASLHRRLYRIAPTAGLYTRDVVILRESQSEGHKLLVPETPVENLPVVSALSVAGIRRPDVKGLGDEVEAEAEAGQPEAAETSAVEVAGSEPKSEDVGEPSDAKGKWKKNGKDKVKAPKPKGPLVFADPAARVLTKDKMRLCLRMAAAKGHTMLVLGAIGCGAFRNPPQEIATCWLEVLSEAEFAGGWFKEIWFAVFDRRNEGNFEIFRDVFDGKGVGIVEAAGISA